MRFIEILGLKMGSGPNFVHVSWCHTTGIFIFDHFLGIDTAHNSLLVRWYVDDGQMVVKYLVFEHDDRNSPFFDVNGKSHLSEPMEPWKKLMAKKVNHLQIQKSFEIMVSCRFSCNQPGESGQIRDRTALRQGRIHVNGCVVTAADAPAAQPGGAMKRNILGMCIIHIYIHMYIHMHWCIYISCILRVEVYNTVYIMHICDVYCIQDIVNLYMHGVAHRTALGRLGTRQ